MSDPAKKGVQGAPEFDESLYDDGIGGDTTTDTTDDRDEDEVLQQAALDAQDADTNTGTSNGDSNSSDSSSAVGANDGIELAFLDIPDLDEDPSGSASDGKPQDAVGAPQERAGAPQGHGVGDRAPATNQEKKTYTAEEWKTSQDRITQDIESLDKQLEPFAKKNQQTADPTLQQLISIIVDSTGDKARHGATNLGVPATDASQKETQRLEEAQRKTFDFLRDYLESAKPVDHHGQELEIARACILISSGTDANIKKGEEGLVELVKRDPSLQANERFHDIVLSSYLRMAATRAAGGLEPYRSERDADSAEPEQVTTGGAKRTPMDSLSSANDKFWQSGIDSALPDFKEAQLSADVAEVEADRERAAAFLRGLDKDIEIANAVQKGEDFETLISERSGILQEEKQLTVRAQQSGDLSTAVTINTAFAKIAGGSEEQYKEGLKEIAEQLRLHPETALAPNFQVNFEKALTAHFANGGKADDRGEQPKADGEVAGEGPDLKPKIGFRGLDLTDKDIVARANNDPEVQAYAADQITTLALTGLTIGVGTLAAIRSMQRYREHRALAAEYGPKPIEDASTPKEFRYRGTMGDTAEVKVRGTVPGTDLMVVQDPNSKNDWKRNVDYSGKPIEEGFDPKKREYGDYKRVVVDGRDFYVDKDNRVFVHHKDKLHETEEIKVLSPKQQEIAQREVNSLLNPETAHEIYRTIYDSLGTNFEDYARAAKMMNVPTPVIALADGKAIDGAAGYVVGKGLIVTTGDMMIPMGEVKEERARQMIHEFEHLEQDTLIVRRLADKVGISKTATDEQKAELLKAYEDKIGFPLEPTFADQVLKTRDGRRLTEREAARADHLADGFVSPHNSEQRFLKHAKERTELLLNRVAPEMVYPQPKRSAGELLSLFAEKDFAFEVALGEKPPQIVQELIDQWKGVKPPEKPAFWNDKLATKVLGDYLNKRLGELNLDEAQGGTARERSIAKRATGVLDSLGVAYQPRGKSALETGHYLASLANLDVIVGQPVDPALIKFIDQFKNVPEGQVPPGWNEETAKQELTRALTKQVGGLDQQIQNIYFADPMEQEAYEVSRNTEISSERPFNWKDRPGYPETYELAERLIGNDTARVVGAEFHKVVSQPDFVMSNEQAQGEKLTATVKDALRKQMGLAPDAPLPGPFNDLVVRVGDFDKAQMHLIDPAKNAFEIRIPGTMLRSEAGRIDATASLYAEVQSLSTLSSLARGRHAASLINGAGDVPLSTNSAAMRGVVRNALLQPDSVHFGSTDGPPPVESTAPVLLSNKSTYPALEKIWNDPATPVELKNDTAINMLRRSWDRRGVTSWAANVPEKERGEAFEYLMEKKPPGYEAILSDIAKAEVEPFGKRASDYLNELWTRDVQPAEGRSVNSLVTGDVIKDFAEKLVDIKWETGFRELHNLQSERARIMDFDFAVSRFQKRISNDSLAFKVFGDFSDPAKVMEHLKDHPQLRKAYQDIQNDRERAEFIDKKVEEILESRRQVLEQHVQQFCRERGLPIPSFEFEKRYGNAGGSYGVGQNAIRLSRDLILKTGGNGPGAEIIKTLIHEVGHHEQNTIVLRHFADEVGIGKTATAEQRKALIEMHKARTGYDLQSESFVDEVLQQRDGKALSEGDKTRAIDLVASFKDMTSDQERRTASEEQLQKLRQTKESLEFNNKISDVLQNQNFEEGVKKALGVDRVPPDVQKAYEEFVATQPKKDPFLSSAAHSRLRGSLIRAIDARTAEITGDNYHRYRERLHEVETHDIGQRASFFAGKKYHRELVTIPGTEGGVDTGDGTEFDGARDTISEGRETKSAESSRKASAEAAREVEPGFEVARKQESFRITVNGQSADLVPGSEPKEIGNNSNADIASRVNTLVGVDTTGRLYIVKPFASASLKLNGIEVDAFNNMEPGDRLYLHGNVAAGDKISFNGVDFNFTKIDALDFNASTQHLTTIDATPAPAVDQSRRMREGGYIPPSEKLVPGFEFTEEHVTPAGDSRERVPTVVDPAKDPILADVLRDAKARFGSIADPVEKMRAVTRYVHDLMTPDAVPSPGGVLRRFDSDQAMWDLDQKFSDGKTKIYLGEYVRNRVGTCVPQSLMVKAIGDHLGLNVGLQHGMFGAEVGFDGGRHIWNTLQVEGNKEIHFDSRYKVSGASAPDLLKDGYKMRGREEALLVASAPEKDYSPAIELEALPRSERPPTLEELLGLNSEEAPAEKSLADRVMDSRADLTGAPEGSREKAWQDHIKVVQEVSQKVHDLEMRMAELSASELAEYKELKTQLKIENQMRSALISRDAPAYNQIDSFYTTGGIEKGGDATQGMVVKHLRKMMDQPSKALGGRTPAEAGFVLIPIKSETALDGIGWDAILHNRNTGEFVFLDPTRDNPQAEGSRKANLPRMHADGLIYVDARIVEMSDKHDIINARLEDNLRRFDPAKRGEQSAPLNLVDVDMVSVLNSPGQKVKQVKMDVPALVEMVNTHPDPAKRAEYCKQLDARFDAILGTQKSITDQIGKMEARARALSRSQSTTVALSQEAGERATDLGDYNALAKHKSRYFDHRKDDVERIRNRTQAELKVAAQQKAAAEAFVPNTADKLAPKEAIEEFRRKLIAWDFDKLTAESADANGVASMAVEDFIGERGLDKDPLFKDVQVEFTSEVKEPKLNFKFSDHSFQSEFEVIGLDPDGKLVVNELESKIEKGEARAIIQLPESYRTDPALRAKAAEVIFGQLARLEMISTGANLPPGKTASEVKASKELLAAARKQETAVQDEILRRLDGSKQLRFGDTTSGANDLLYEAPPDAQPLEPAPKPQVDLSGVKPPIEKQRLEEIRTKLLAVDGSKESYFSDLLNEAKNLFSDHGSRERFKTAFRTDAKLGQRLTLHESADLAAGKSELVFTSGGAKIEPKQFHSGPPPVFELADGKSVNAKDCSLEIRLGSGTSHADAAREVALRMNDLVQFIDMREASPAELGRLTMQRQKMEQMWDAAREAGSAAAATEGGGDQGKREGYDLRSKLPDIEFTANGIRIGKQVLPYEDALAKAIKDHEGKETAAKTPDEKERLRAERLKLVELKQQLEKAETRQAALETLHREMKTIIPDEVGRIAEGGRGSAAGRAFEIGKAQTGRAAAYLILGSFIAGMIASQSEHSSADGGMAPFTATSR